MIIKSIVLLALVVAGLPSRYQTAISEHRIKFFLDPALVTDMAYAETVLPAYVSDINTILAKNTTRRVAFDPASDIILTATKPQTNSGPNPLPTDGFEIWVHAVASHTSGSFGGWMSMDKSGAGVVAGLYWAKLHDPNNLTGDETHDYLLQIHTILHEIAHIFGAGVGEYYNLTWIEDTTQTNPIQGISFGYPWDPFWKTKPDFRRDPLLQFTYTNTRSEYLSAVKYAQLTATVMNGSYRNGIQSFDTMRVKVVNRYYRPMPGVRVKIWNINGYPPYANTLLFSGLTDQAGVVMVPWGGTGMQHNAGNFLRLIKVYKRGKPIAHPRYVSIFDADIDKLVFGRPNLAVKIRKWSQ